MGYPREAVAELLIPAFLPFNLLKGGLNAAITMLIYKPVSYTHLDVYKRQTKERSIWDLERMLYEKKPKIKLLVNAAGYGKIGHFQELTYQDNAGMIELNCRGLTAVTYACLPSMLPNGRIIQLASSEMCIRDRC